MIITLNSVRIIQHIPDRMADLVCKHLTQHTELIRAVVVQVAIHHFLISVHLHNFTAALENFIISSRQAMQHLSIPPLTPRYSATRDNTIEMIL